MNSNIVIGLTLQVYQTLADIDEKGTVVPLLAERWECSPDGLTWTFFLRKGVKFHDGMPFNANAVVANFKHLLDPRMKYSRAGFFSFIKDTKVVDEDKVQFQIASRYGALPAAISYFPAGQLSPAALAQGPA